MKSIACISTSVRAVCQHTSGCFPLTRPLVLCGPVSRCSSLHTGGTGKIAQPCTTHAHTLQTRTHTNTVVIQQVHAGPPPTPRLSEQDVSVYQIGRRVPPRAASHLRSVKSQSDAAAVVCSDPSQFEGQVIPELRSRLGHLPSRNRADRLSAQLKACVESGLGARSPLVTALMDETRQLLLSSRDVGVLQLCRLGRAAYALEGARSATLSGVLDRMGTVLEEEAVSPREAAGAYALLALCHDPGSQQQALVLSALHTHTQRLVHRLTPGQVGDVLQVLAELQQSSVHLQAITLVLRLSHRASRVFKAFTDEEVVKVLSALMILGQHDEELLAAMEKHLPGRLGKSDPELISTVMEYCLQMRCRSEPIFEAVAENFVQHAETHTTLQIARQIVAMGRLNYLPQCSSQMFKKLESILSSRFSQFQPRSLIEVLHACIHLERFPLNYMSKVFNPYFLQRMEAQEPLDKKSLGQLTQLHLSTSLECTHYFGPRLPFFLHVKRFSSVDQAFETPMEGLIYRQVKGPLTQLLGGEFYSRAVHTQCGYTIDVEICLDEDGLVLPSYLWDHTSRRIALCVDGQNRFCTNTNHLLGKEATKRRHLRRMGYEVVQIPYFEFEKLDSQEEQVQYLHNKIFPIIFKFSHRPESV